MKFLTGDNFCPPGTLSDIWRQSGLLQVEEDTATPILWVEAMDVAAAAAAAKSLQSSPTATPETAAHQTPPSLGFSRQEHWSGLPFPSQMHESEK